VSAVVTRTLQPIRGSRRSRLVLVALATALAVVASAVVTVVIGAGAFGSPAPLPSTTPVVDAGGDLATDSAAPGDDSIGSVLPVVTYEVFLSRDPFDPVVPEEEPVSTVDTSDPNVVVDPANPVVVVDPANPVVVVNPTDPAAPLPVLPPSEPGDPRCIGQEELVCDGRVVTLLETTMIDGVPVAVIQVGATVYEVRVGETFAGTFVLVAINPPSATILYGDETNVLSPGRSILK
jgi:hypothetical protein